jgi:hypothetical protein
LQRETGLYIDQTEITMPSQRNAVASKNNTVTSGVTVGRTEPGPVGTVRASDWIEIEDDSDSVGYIIAPRSNRR